MKTINNFDIIRPLIYWSREDNLFALVQIVKRAKDHPGKKVTEGAINTYYVRSAEQLDRLMPEMIALANLHGARVYINPSPKSFKKLQEDTLSELLRKQIVGEIDNPAHVTKSMAGKLKSEKNKAWWVIDIDDDTAHFTPAIMQFLEDNNREWVTVPTFSFKHLLAHPFNKKAFSEEFPEIHLHENSMGTLLYAAI